MNNMEFKKKIANKVVNTAIRSAKLSNQKEASSECVSR